MFEMKHKLGATHLGLLVFILCVVYLLGMLLNQEHRLYQLDTGPDVFLIPSDDILTSSSDTQLIDIYWRYINSIQTLCNKIVRFGTLQDGGKDICLDPPYVPSHGCLVYSFGCGFQFQFENAVHDKFGCESHTYDPTLNMTGREKDVPKHVDLNAIGLSSKDEVNSEGWRMKRFTTILQEHGNANRMIDILKMDIEGGEYLGFDDIFSTDILTRVRQISVEIHFGRKNLTNPLDPEEPFWGDVDMTKQLSVLRRLYEHGFRIFMREHNLSTASTVPDVGDITSVNEITMINTRWRHTNKRSVRRKV